MHNIGLLLVRMGKFRDAVTNFQHVMQEQGDFQTGTVQVLINIYLIFKAFACHYSPCKQITYILVLQVCILYCVL